MRHRPIPKNGPFELANSIYGRVRRYRRVIDLASGPNTKLISNMDGGACLEIRDAIKTASSLIVLAFALPAASTSATARQLTVASFIIRASDNSIYRK
jgi:hypothetical protein